MAKAVAIRLVLCIPRSAPNDILLFSTEFACFLKEYLHKFINLLRTLAPHVSIMKPIYTRDSLFFSSQHHLQLNSVHDWNMGARHPSCWERSSKMSNHQPYPENLLLDISRYHGNIPMVSQTIVQPPYPNIRPHGPSRAARHATRHGFVEGWSSEKSGGLPEPQAVSARHHFFCGAFAFFFSHCISIVNFDIIHTITTQFL
jgi:hypothetical protein